MIVPDINLLLYAHFRGFTHHVRARRWWEQLLNGDTEVALSAPAVFGFLRLLRALGGAGNLKTNMQLAALAIEEQGELHSNDTDFARFPRLRWVNPLR